MLIYFTGGLLIPFPWIVLPYNLWKSFPLISVLHPNRLKIIALHSFTPKLNILATIHTKTRISSPSFHYLMFTHQKLIIQLFTWCLFLNVLLHLMSITLMQCQELDRSHFVTEFFASYQQIFLSQFSPEHQLPACPSSLPIIFPCSIQTYTKMH